jgi:hypothetical protein
MGSVSMTDPRDCLRWRKAVLIAGLLSMPTTWAAERQSLPAEFIQNRVFVVPRLADGTPLRFYTDSGGGWNMLPAELAERIGLRPGPDAQYDDGLPQKTVEFPIFAADAAIPHPVADRWLDNRLAIVPGQGSADGFLGNRWFAERIWEFDYGAGTLALLAPGAIPSGMVRIPMTMRGDNMYWPRIVVEIDGEPIPLLLDTGAKATLAAGAAQALGVSAGTEVATSFITATHFGQWRERHPDWPVVADGDRIGQSVMPMIRVPEVEIAGHRVGPVWFAMRPDRSFTEFMSSMTDEPVEGAIGGSAFRYFRMVLDYPGRAAWFAPLVPADDTGRGR